MADSSLQKLRHSAAHLLAHAVKELFPSTLLTIGPATKEGFFYDFLPTQNFKETDLALLTAKMHEIAKRNLPITHEQVPKKEARELFKHNPFKLELIDGIDDLTVGIARQGDFIDLCKGGHVASTGEIKHFKLLNISGAYWRADRNNQALQRISGTSFATAKELRVYEQRREQALKYDHRKLGKQLDLFSFHQEGVGFPFFHARGTIVLQQMKEYLRTLLRADGYREIQTPLMLSDSLWKQSGHYQHYKDNMFFCQTHNMDYAVRPMNCPGAILLYKERPRSFRELPLRLSEFGLVHRYELSGVLHGLFRARAFTIDDGHIFCTPEEIEQEVLRTINITLQVIKRLGFEKIEVGLSTRPKDAMGSPKLWEQATEALSSALQTAGLSYEVYEGEGAFYGPKIEFGIEDSIGRSWQCGTIQLDFFQPENFDLEYVASGGHKKRPVMIHRAIYGSFERMFAILLEHYKGALPFWLAPIQARILTITDEQNSYALELLEQLHEQGIRAEIAPQGEQISAKIKVTQLDKIPWMIIIGDKEVQQQTVTLRYLSGKQAHDLSIRDLLNKASQAL